MNAEQWSQLVKFFEAMKGETVAYRFKDYVKFPDAIRFTAAPSSFRADIVIADPKDEK